MDEAAAVGIAGDDGGAAVAAYIAFDEAYDPTQVFASVLAIALLISFVLDLTPLRAWSASGAAGALFFSGSMLASVDGGVAILTLGAVAGVASAIAAWHDRREVLPSLASFFAGGIASALVVVLIILTVEG